MLGMGLILTDPLPTNCFWEGKGKERLSIIWEVGSGGIGGGWVGGTMEPLEPFKKLGETKTSRKK